VATIISSWISSLAIEAGTPYAKALGLSSAPANYATIAEWLAVFISSAIPPIITIRLLDRVWIFDRIVAQICTLLESRAAKQDTENEIADSLLIDPLGDRREDLGRLALQLSDAARALDARQTHGTAPHPVSTLLRAVSQSIHRFLRNQQSWSVSIPDEIIEMFQHAAFTLVKPDYVVGFQMLQKQNRAFDANGDPIVDAEEKPPSRMIIMLNRAAAGFKGFVAAVVGMATITAIAIVCVLYAQHRISIIDFQHYLP
jgi:hypothetical protein